MKRILAFCAPFAFAACGGTGQLELQLTHDSTQVTNSYLLAGDPAYATTITAAISIPINFNSGVAAIDIPVTEVDVHVAGDDANDLVDPAKDVINDDDGAWHTVVSYGSNPQTYNLASLNLTTQRIGTVELPTGKVTQIRLRVAAQDLPDPDYSIIPDAITLSDLTTTCDLVVPRSAVNPGVKIEGIFKAVEIDKDAKVTAVVNLELNEEQDASLPNCTYRLNPVLKIKNVQ